MMSADASYPEEVPDSGQGVAMEDVDLLYDESGDLLPNLRHLPALHPLTTSLPSSTLPTPSSASHALPTRAPPPAPPLVDYVCLFSHELHPFQHTCSLDFLSPKAVLKGELTYAVPSKAQCASPCAVPLPDCLEHFVYPSGIVLVPTAPPATSHSFVLTLTTGDRLHGYCRTVHLPVSAAALSVVRMQAAERLMKDPTLIAAGHKLPSVLYSPHSLCVLARTAFTSAYVQLLERVVGQWGLTADVAVDVANGLYSALHAEIPRVQTRSSQSNSDQSRSRSRSTRSQSQSQSSALSSSSSPSSIPSSPRTTLPEEASSRLSTAALASPVHSLVPLSPVGEAVRLRVVALLPALPFVLPCWPWSSCPLIDPPSLSLLFIHLSPATVVQLFNLLLSETSVLLISSSLHVLTPLVESISALLYPLRWPYIYIPLLPLSLADFFQAPQPFLIGAPSTILPLLPSDTAMAVVDCDRDEVRLQGGAVYEQLPWVLCWRLWQSMWEIFPGWGLLHVEEERRVPEGLPTSAVCRVVLEEEGRERRERRGKAAVGRRRRDPCRLDSVDCSKHRRALLSLRTARLLHSGTEAEDEDSDDRARRSAYDDEDDVAIAEGDPSSVDLSADDEHGDGPLSSAAVSPALDPRDDDSVHPPPLLPVSFPPSSPYSAALPSPPSPALLAVPSMTRGRSALSSSGSTHRSSSTPPAHAPTEMTAPSFAPPPSAPAASLPDPPSFPALPASYTMSAAQDDGDLPPITPQSAYPVLTSSRSFGGPSHKPRRSLNPLTLPPPHPTPQPSPAFAPSSSPLSPALLYQSSPAIPLDEVDRWSSLYNLDGILTLPTRRAHRLRRAFLRVLVSLLRPYRQCIGAARAGWKGGVEEAFDGERFVEASHAAYQPFLRSFVDSQLMRYFLQDRRMEGEAGWTEGREPGKPTSALSSTLSPQSSWSPPSPSSPSSSDPSPSPRHTQPTSAASQPPPPPPDYFERLLMASTRVQTTRHRRLLSTPLSSVLYALGHRVPVWRERWFELGQGGMSVRMFSVSERMEEVEKRYRALRDAWKRRRRSSARGKLPGKWRDRDEVGAHSPRHSADEDVTAANALDEDGDADLVLKASLDRVGEQREALRAQLHKGTIKLEPGHTSVSVPDDRRSLVTPFVWELAVRDKRWLFCAPDADTRDDWLACIKARVGRYQQGKSEGHSHVSVAESALQQQLRLLREEQLRLFEQHIQDKVQKLIHAPSSSSPDSLPLFTSSHTRRSLSSNTTPMPSPHPSTSSVHPSPSHAVLSRALLCAEMMLRHLDIRERVWRLRSWPGCFVGAECVQWMVSTGMVKDARHGVDVGNVLIGYRVIRHVGGQFVFKNDDSLYQFILHAQQQPTASVASSSAASGSATSLPASLVTTPSHGHALSSRPTPEDALILSTLQSSLHIRTHRTGLFHTPHPHTFRGSDALDWLVDSGVMRQEDDGLRWMRRMIKMEQMEAVDAGGTFRGGAGLYRFRKGEKAAWGSAGVERVQEEKDCERDDADGEPEVNGLHEVEKDVSASTVVRGVVHGTT